MLLRLVIPIIIANTPILLQVLAEPGKYNSFKFWFLYLLFFFFTIVYFYFVEFSHNLNLSKNQFDLILNRIFLKIKDELRTISNIECEVCIMKPKFNISPFYGKDKFLRRCLFVEYPLVLEDRLGFRLIHPVGIGVAGKAFKDERPMIADLDKVGQNGFSDWDLCATDLRLIKGIRSAIAVPIRDSKHKDKVIGVLKLFSKRPLEETPFKNKSFQSYLIKEAMYISVLIT